MFGEHEQIVLAESAVSDEGEALKPGDVGCVLHVHPNGAAAVVEFMSLDDEKVEVATMLPTQSRPVATITATHGVN